MVLEQVRVVEQGLELYLVLVLVVELFRVVEFRGLALAVQESLAPVWGLAEEMAKDVEKVLDPDQELEPEKVLLLVLVLEKV